MGGELAGSPCGVGLSAVEDDGKGDIGGMSDDGPGGIDGDAGAIFGGYNIEGSVGGIGVIGIVEVSLEGDAKILAEGHLSFEDEDIGVPGGGNFIEGIDGVGGGDEQAFGQDLVGRIMFEQVFPGRQVDRLLGIGRDGQLLRRESRVGRLADGDGGGQAGGGEA